MRRIKLFSQFTNESLFDLFREKPLGNIEVAKRDSLNSIREFLKRYSGLANVDGLSEKQLLELIQGFARHKDRSKENAMAYEIWRIAKPLFR